MTEDPLRQLQVDAWFEPPIAIDDAYWPFSLAVAWIAWRDPILSSRAAEDIRAHGRRAWLTYGDEHRDAEAALKRALLSGGVMAFGRREGASLQRIESHEWVTLRFFGSNPDDMLDLAIGDDGLSVYRDIRVASAGVLAMSPAAGTAITATSTIATRRMTGPRPKVGPRVKALMRAKSVTVLRGMKVTEMAAEFGAAGSFCTKLRREVLGDTN